MSKPNPPRWLREAPQKLGAAVQEYEGCDRPAIRTVILAEFPRTLRVLEAVWRDVGEFESALEDTRNYRSVMELIEEHVDRVRALIEDGGEE